VGITAAQLFTGTVMHKRLLPRKHVFHYGIYYLALPLSQLSDMPLAYNHFAPLSFYDKDHGARDGSSLEKWARELLLQHHIEAGGEITLICMPRVFGYVFNPVSFWLCQDKEGQVRAVLCEVHNTFGEQHTYLCAHQDRRAITGSSSLFAEKLFHVSPFLEREGHYEFRFDIHDKHFNVMINFHNQKGHKQLVTSLAGTLQSLSKTNLRYAFWRYPLVTIKATLMIHWHALKLIAKRIQYFAKPKQKNQKVSTTHL
jgi:uncharacterized protein